MTRKRERIMIIHDILKTIQDKRGNIKPTHILYRSNLSSQMLKEYLADLIEKEFIVELLEKNKKKTYRLTEKGTMYLQDFGMIKSFIESYGLDE